MSELVAVPIGTIGELTPRGASVYTKQEKNWGTRSGLRYFPTPYQFSKTPRELNYKYDRYRNHDECAVQATGSCDWRKSVWG